MDFLQKGASAIGRLLMLGALAATFIAGVLGVGYLQLKGNEITIPKVVGKNFNVGGDELAANGLRIKKISSRYSEEPPNTILEQRPKAGTIAKTGLMISVVVSQANPDGNEAPAEVKDDEEVIEEIKDLPELKTDKAKKKARSKPKTTNKTRDVIDKPTTDEPGTTGAPGGGDDAKTTNQTDQKPAPDGKPKPDTKVPPPPKLKPDKVKPKTT